MKKSGGRFTKKKKNRTGRIVYKTIYNKVEMEYENGTFFEVEAILDRKGEDDAPKYLIKWKNWHKSTNTWEPPEYLKNVKHLVKEFELSRDPSKDLSFLDVFFEESGIESMESEPGGDLYRDVPQTIKKIYEDNGKFYAEIEWLIRGESGVKPYNTHVIRDELKEKYVLLLIEYYESKIKFFK